MSLSAWLLTIPQWLSASLVIGFFVAFGVVLLLVVRRLVHHSVLKPHNDIAGFIFATLGVIYGVVLAFVVLYVWEQYDHAQQVTEDEFSQAYALYRDLNLYPDRDAAGKALDSLRRLSISIAREEFPAIKAMQWDSRYSSSDGNRDASDEVWLRIKQIVPQNLHEQALYAEILRDVNAMAQLRAKRRLMAHEDLPEMVWVVVIAGGLITVGFCALFGHENLRGHLVLTVLLAVVVGGVVDLIVNLNFPFNGPLSIGPDGYQYLIRLAGW